MVGPDDAARGRRHTTYILDAERVIKGVIASDVVEQARAFADYLWKKAVPEAS